MEITQALEIVRVLADGIDPNTGSMMPANSPYQHPQIVRALHVAVRKLESAVHHEKRKSAFPTDKMKISD